MKDLTEEEEFHDPDREARAPIREMIRKGASRPAGVSFWEWTEAYNEVFLEARGRQLGVLPAKASAE